MPIIKHKLLECPSQALGDCLSVPLAFHWIKKKFPEDTPALHCPVTVPGGPAVPSKKTGVFLHLLAFQEEF